LESYTLAISLAEYCATQHGLPKHDSEIFLLLLLLFFDLDDEVKF